MAVRQIAATWPEALLDMVERLREVEHRSRSEVFKEPLRRHFGEPVYAPTDQERRLLDAAIAVTGRLPDAEPGSEVRDGLLAE